MVHQIDRTVVERVLIVLISLSLGQGLAQDAPACPPPVPICRSYEISSCEYALNMIPVYVCRADIGNILGIIGSGLGYVTRPQMVYQQPYSPASLYSSYSPPQPIYAPYTRSSAQYRSPNTFITAREVENDLPISSVSPQGSAGSQIGSYAGRPQGQSVFQGAAREVGSIGVPLAPNNSLATGYGQRGPPYQTPQSSPNPVPQPQPSPQTPYAGNAPMANEDQPNK